MSVIPSQQPDSLFPQPSQELAGLLMLYAGGTALPLDEPVLHRQPTPSIQQVIPDAVSPFRHSPMATHLSNRPDSPGLARTTMSVLPRLTFRTWAF